MIIVADKAVWNKLKKSFRAVESLENQLGWQADAKYGAENANLQMAQVAKWQEEGTEGGQGNGSGIPPRPFMRVGLRDKLKAGTNKESFKQMVIAVATGKDVFRAFHNEGDSFRQTLRQVMIDWTEPGNADATIRTKGFNDPLVETSQLIANITSTTVRKGA